jgi:hypothetical protein
MLIKDNLTLLETKVGNRFRFSYEDYFGPSAEGLIDIFWDHKTEGDGYNDPIYTSSEVQIRFEKIKIWDVEGFTEITHTELGERFTEELKELIKEYQL